MEGNAFRLLPVRNPNPERELVNTELAFENLTKKNSYRGLDSDKPYYNIDYRGFVQNQRSTFNDLVAALIEEGKMDKAREAMMFSLYKMPDKGVKFEVTAIGYGNSQGTIELLFRLGENEKALEIASLTGDRALENARYYFLRGDYYNESGRRSLIILGELQNILYKYGEDKSAKKYEDGYNDILKMLEVNSPPDRRDF